MIKCERGKGVVRFIINELLANESNFIIEEINKADVSYYNIFNMIQI